MELTAAGTVLDLHKIPILIPILTKKHRNQKRHKSNL